MKTRNQKPRKTWIEKDSSSSDEENNYDRRKPKTNEFEGRYALFDPPRKPEKDFFLKSVSRRITLLSLRVSHIENRLADYETRYEIEKNDIEPVLRDPPYDPPRKSFTKQNKFDSPNSYSLNSFNE